MELTDLITPDHVIARMRATSKKQALQELARRSAEVSGLEQREIFDILLERERLGTTVGRGGPSEGSRQGLAHVAGSDHMHAIAWLRGRRRHLRAFGRDLHLERRMIPEDRAAASDRL